MVEEPTDGDAARLAALLRGDVAALLTAVAHTGVESLRLEDGDVAIEVTRAPAAHVAAIGPTGEVAVVRAGPVVTGAQADVSAGPTPLRSLSVGFFHRSRVEGAPNLVEDGATIDAGDVVAVVETLGMAGEVVASVAGILEFSIDDGHPVGFGDVLAVIHPT